MCGSRCDVITLLAALLAAVSLIGCATRIMIPEEEVASGFLLAHPSVEVKDTCPDVLAEYLMGEAPAEKPRCDELVTWEVRRRAFSMCCTSVLHRYGASQQGEIFGGGRGAVEHPCHADGRGNGASHLPPSAVEIGCDTAERRHEGERVHRCSHGGS